MISCSMEQQTMFCSYRAGEVPPVKRIETDGEVPLLGFKDNIPVVVSKPRPVPPKKLIVKKDTTTGKTFIVVNGKKVEVMKVNKKGVEKTATTTVQQPVGTDKSENIINRTKDMQTCTDGLITTTSVAVQTEEPKPILLFPQMSKLQLIPEDDNCIIGKDVRMGYGPKCPTPQVNHYYEKFETPVNPQQLHTNFSQSKPNNRKEQLLQLIKQDYAECESFDIAGNMPIHCAVIENNPDYVRRHCVALKFKGVSINTTNINNLTPLQLAVYHEADISIFEVLLHYGADPSVLDADGNNVIHLAVMQSKEDILEVLLNNVGLVPIDAFNYEGLTPLMICSCNKKVNMAKMLLENHVDPNMRDQKSGRTALFHAVEAHDVEMVRLLMRYKANPKIKNFLGMSPHDAIFEIDDMDNRIVLAVLGKDQPQQSRLRTKRKATSASKSNVKIAMERKYQKCYVNNKVRIADI